MFVQLNYEDISHLYSSLHNQRYQKIISQFEKIYGCKPEFIARAPGRVNIIGEHIDYSGYGVLPAAIQKDCLIAVRRNDTKDININHIDHEKYPKSLIPIKPSDKMQFQNNYVKYFSAGYYASTHKLNQQQLAGMDILIQGNIPVASGVSSSSALCVCSALATHHALNKVQYHKNQFIEDVIKSERLVGTASGGMDQSISVLGQQNSCLFIEFNPIRSSVVNIPAKFKFVVMNCLVQSAKLNTAAFRYNKRVCECRLATNVLAKKVGISDEVRKTLKNLKQLQQLINVPLHRMDTIILQFLSQQLYTVKDIQDILGENVKDIIKDIQLWQLVYDSNKQYALYEIAIHVYNQADRVISFVQVCNSKMNDLEKIRILGRLMNESQLSCKQLYNCSCTELDQLTSLALKAGAFGSRLTGAGWGGCTVSLVAEQKVQQFMDTMIKTYYSQEKVKQAMLKQGKQNVIFVTKPTKGACIIKM